MPEKKMPPNNSTTSRKRVFLFLQGHPSSFACKLANELSQHGHEARRINLCLGDALYWRGRKADNYRGRFGNWPTYLKDYIERHKVTDLLYYGDRRPYHVVACKLAKQMGIRAYTYEFGYLRPDWITIERDGMGGYSHFPNDPELIRQIGEKFKTPDMEARFPYTKELELKNEIIYHFSTFFVPFAYPFYHADRYYNLLLEYAAGIPGTFAEARNNKRAQAVIDTIISAQQPFYLFPLQLQNDYQLRDNASFKHQGDAIRLALCSFAKHAPENALLLFKQHPLDNGWENWPRIIEQEANRLGIVERTKLLVGGDLDQMLEHAKGCVLINSTVGLHALLANCPVKVLGKALYDIKGLCHQGALDEFWSHPPSPDIELTNALVRALSGTIQVKGNFFTPEGQKASIPQLAKMLIENRVNSAGAYVTPAPRLP